MHSALKKMSESGDQVEAQKQQIDQLRTQLQHNNRRSAVAITGAAFLLGSAVTYGLDGYQPLIVAGASIISWMMGGIGLFMLVTVLR